MARMTQLTERARRKMGKRAAEYVDAHHVTSVSGGALLVADLYETPEGVANTLTRIYGRPRTTDRSEIAYWAIGGDDVIVET